MSAPDELKIDVGFPQEGEPQLHIRVGGCRLKMRGGGGAQWVSGSYRDPSHSLPCRVVEHGATLDITQELNVSSLTRISDGSPTLDLTLGDAMPYTVALEGGASDCKLDLGGLPITRLSMRQGAGRYELDFSLPTAVPMQLLEIAGGAAAMDLRNLGNAGFVELRLDGGASAYTIDFGGELRRDGQVRITAGAAGVEISVPESTAATVRSESVLAQVKVGDGFTTRQGAYWTGPAVAGKTPLLRIEAKVAVGMLRLRIGPPAPLPLSSGN
ncbi:MAG TPA: hypothetical protein VMU89_02875 [Thermomicrobiaceae bacterium]|nr:hypothetical protein [Thermomicrobiaceae bacterium]